MAIILKANKVNLFVSSVLFVFVWFILHIQYGKMFSDIWKVMIVAEF
jgi:hypothetical protein